MEDRPASEDFYVPPDADDPFPPPSEWDRWQEVFNRWCEEGARWARILGVL